MSVVPSLRRRAAHVPLPIRIGLFAATFALTVYWWATYAGLYRLLAEWQLARMGSYGVELTAVFTLLALLVPVLLIVVIIGASREGERGQAHAERVEAADHAQRDRWNAWVREHRRRATALGAGVALTVWGAWLIASGLLAGARVTLDVAALERGAPPPGRYVELLGHLLPDRAAGVSGNRSAEMIYVPLVSAPEAPARVYLKVAPSVARDHRRELASGRYEGLLEANALPGVAVTVFTDQGRPPADGSWVLDYLATPAHRIEEGRLFVLVGVAMAGLAGLVWWVMARRKRAVTTSAPG